MLISVYAAFRWAGTKKYLLKMVLFIVAVSFFSSGLDFYVLPEPVAFFFLFVPSFLSFPFFTDALFNEHRLILAAPYYFSQRIQVYSLRFFFTEVLSFVPQGSVIASLGNGQGYVDVVSYKVILMSTEIGAVPTSPIYALTVIFMFLILANAAGALLGYAISRLPFLKKPRWKPAGLVVGLTLMILLFVIGTWLYATGPIIETTTPNPYYYDQDSYGASSQGFILIMFGIIWLVVMMLEITRTEWDKRWLIPKAPQ